jgi:hypothetical protein
VTTMRPITRCKRADYLSKVGHVIKTRGTHSKGRHEQQTSMYHRNRREMTTQSICPPNLRFLFYLSSSIVSAYQQSRWKITIRIVILRVATGYYNILNQSWWYVSTTVSILLLGLNFNCGTQENNLDNFSTPEQINKLPNAHDLPQKSLRKQRTQ